MGIEHLLLEQLNLNNNKITSCEGLEDDKLMNLETIQLRSNLLTNTAGLESFQNLKFLFMLNFEKTIMTFDIHKIIFEKYLLATIKSHL